jgi:SAM-dependent methyltransferase
MAKLVDKLKALYHKLPDPPSTTSGFKDPDHKIFQDLPTNPLVFDIGSKRSAGKYKLLGGLPEQCRVVTVDLFEGPGIDLVADAHDLHMVESETVDCILCANVLEHVKYPTQVASEFFRILKPGGKVYINTPFIFPYHADPDDYYRYSYNGLALVFDKFECLEKSYVRGPSSTMQHLLVNYLALLFSFNNKTIHGINIDLFKYLLFWIKYLDKLIANYDMAYVLQNSTYFIGRKPASGEQSL